MIEVKNLTKSFGGVPVLKGITETISPGEKIAIIGLPAPANPPFCAV